MVNTINLIDISSWQRTIDLKTVFDLNPELDGVIVKATEGTAYTNSDFRSWMDWLSKRDKLMGMYHFCSGGNAASEAEHFYAATRDYIGRAIPIADYEGTCLAKGTGWLKAFVNRFRELSGVLPMVYCSLSVIHEQDFNGLTDCPLWVAQYADMYIVYGFLDNPWQQGSVSPFDKYWMHQYTGNGRLNGYASALDLDKFYGTAEDWQSLCRGTSSTTAPTPTPSVKLKPSDPSIVLRVLQNKGGEIGIGTERILRLKELGYDPDSVQKKINQLYNIAGKLKKEIGSQMDYLNSILWILKS